MSLDAANAPGVITPAAEYADTGTSWSTIGWRVKVDFVPLEHPLRPKDMMDRLGPVLPEKYAPLAADGDGYQHVYLAHVPPPMADVLLDAISPQEKSHLIGLLISGAAVRHVQGVRGLRAATRMARNGAPLVK